MAASTMLMWRSWTSNRTWVRAWVRPTPKGQSAFDAQGDVSCIADGVVVDAPVGVVAAVGAGSCFGAGGVDRGRRRTVGQRPVRPVGVVDV